MIQVTQLAIALQAIFAETADLLAQQLGVVRRRRVFTGGSLVRTLVFGWLHRPKACIDQLAEMAARCGAVVTPQALRQRFTPALNRLLEALIERAVALRQDVEATGQPRTGFAIEDKRPPPRGGEQRGAQRVGESGLGEPGCLLVRARRHQARFHPPGHRLLRDDQQGGDWSVHRASTPLMSRTVRAQPRTVPVTLDFPMRGR